ncbi:DUF1254 domain-containing protein [Pseudomonas arsenicoxydans]|uniref:DUF1254 domain-containing protein n=1 Tax=Pseudomonas arsenicoxydans TaxID=702115 RepID=A0A502HKI2_9PSED|nr:DUF1254 domain-containing protein [Pseudomonas arsenicoxydans]TPG73952.1 DUF1254 domain-containing protein [Pseudomonas arsenicoxydans]
MTQTLKSIAVLAASIALTLPAMAATQTATEIPPGLITPDRLETRIGTLEFKDGAPSVKTTQDVYDTLAFTRGIDAFMNSFSGASAYAIREGFHSIGAEDNSVIIFSELMDAQSLFLTANADTIYTLSILDLTKGPLVVEVPPKSLGTLNDMWFGWIIDLGAPGPDRGEGGKYLIVPPDYNGPLPDSGFFVGRAKTNHVLYAVRAFMENNDPKPAVDLIKDTLKIYPYTPGGYGTSIATALAGQVRLEPNPPTPPTKFVEGSGKSFNTIPPNDFAYYEMLDKLVQLEPATSFDPELLGQLAAIGIVKGKPFAPDERMKKILTEAAAVGNAAGRSLNFRGAEYPGWAYYPNSMWASMLWQGGFDFETPPPMITKEGLFKPFPPTGARTLDSRTAFYYGYTMDSPGMIMRLPNVGSQYLMGFTDAQKNPFDGGKTYKVTLPPNIPAAKFWSFTVYDNQTRSMLQTPQRYPRAGSQTYPSPAAVENADGSTTIYFGPTKPADAKAGNWIQTTPDKGWFTILRLYSPLESFFTKAWRPSELELVR